MKKIPNIISFSRIILSLSLLFIKPLSPIFYILYIICGLTDIFDGFIARKTAATSNLGEKLDSAADLVMTGVVFIILYNKVNLSAEVIIWFISIAALRFVSVITALIKYKRFVILHSYSNKASGMLLFLVPLLFYYIEAGALIHIVCLVASISALEELIIHLTSKELRVNRPCIFAK